MALWGSSNSTISGGTSQEPKNLANNATPHVSMFSRYGNIFANRSGWVQHLPSRNNTVKMEVLVGIRDLSDKIGTPLINEIWFQDTRNDGSVLQLNANTPGKINIAYNMEVSILSATAPTFNIIQSGANTANLAATYTSGNNTNILTFSFTTMADFGGVSNANVNYTVTDQPIKVAAGVIVGKLNNLMNANTLIPTAANTNYPFNGRLVTMNVTHPIVQVTNVFFASATVARNTASNVFVTFSAPVNVLTTALPNVVLNVVAGNTTNAQYASGNGTSNLRFSWTAPQFVANVVTVAPARSLIIGVINDLSANAAVNTFITTAVATASGNATPT